MDRYLIVSGTARDWHLPRLINHSYNCANDWDYRHDCDHTILDSQIVHLLESKVIREVETNDEITMLIL